MSEFVAAVFSDDALLEVICTMLLAGKAYRTLASLAASCTWGAAGARDAVRRAVRRTWPQALLSDESLWLPVWFIMASVGCPVEGPSRLVLRTWHNICRFIFSNAEGPSDYPPEVLEVELVAHTLATTCKRLFGAEGPPALAHIQRRLLRNLCMAHGAWKRVPRVALLNLEKAEAIGERNAVGLAAGDYAEALINRDMSKPFSRWESRNLRDIENSVHAATRARELQHPDGRRLLGRALYYAGQAVMMCGVEPADRSGYRSIVKNLGSGPQLLKCGLNELLGAVKEARQHADDCRMRSGASDANCRLASCVASVADFWFHASVTVQDDHPEHFILLGVAGQRESQARCRDMYEEAIKIFATCDLTKNVVEYANCLRGYGRCLSVFGLGDAPPIVQNPAEKSQRLLAGFMGPRRSRVMW